MPSSESQTVIKTTPEVKLFCGTILTPFRAAAHEPRSQLSENEAKDPRLNLWEKWSGICQEEQEKHMGKKCEKGEY